MLNRYTVKSRIEGSNPSVSAIFQGERATRRRKWPIQLDQAALRQAVLMQSTWRWSVPQQPPSTLI